MRLHDPVNHPKHYTSDPSGVECIQITRHRNFNVGNAIKYLWRAGRKNKDSLEDLKKARWYIDRAITMLENSRRASIVPSSRSGADMPVSIPTATGGGG